MSYHLGASQVSFSDTEVEPIIATPPPGSMTFTLQESEAAFAKKPSTGTYLVGAGILALLAVVALS